MICRADVGYPESPRWLLALAFVTAEPRPHYRCVGADRMNGGLTADDLRGPPIRPSSKVI
jgi:hypothetical protein